MCFNKKSNNMTVRGKESRSNVMTVLKRLNTLIENTKRDRNKYFYLLPMNN